jgi:hypothetical protein
MNNPVSAASVAGPNFAFEPFLADFQPARRDGESENLDFGEVMTATLGVAEALFAYAPISFGGESFPKPVSQENGEFESDVSSFGEIESVQTSPSRDFVLPPLFGETPRALTMARPFIESADAPPAIESSPNLEIFSPSDGEAISLIPETTDASAVAGELLPLTENAPAQNFERLPPSSASEPVINELPSDPVEPKETLPGATPGKTPVGDATAAPRRFPAESPSGEQPPIPFKDAREIVAKPPNKPQVPTSVNDTGGEDMPIRTGWPEFPMRAPEDAKPTESLVVGEPGTDVADQTKTNVRPEAGTGEDGDLPIRTGWPEFPMRAPEDAKPTESPVVGEPATDVADQTKTNVRPEAGTGEDGDLPIRTGWPEFPMRAPEDAKPTESPVVGDSAPPADAAAPMQPERLAVTEELLRERKKAGERGATPTFGPERRPPVLLRPIRTLIETPAPENAPIPPTLAGETGATEPQVSGDGAFGRIADAQTTSVAVSPVPKRLAESGSTQIPTFSPNAPRAGDGAESESPSNVSGRAKPEETTEAARIKNPPDAPPAPPVAPEAPTPARDAAERIFPLVRAAIVAAADQVKETSQKVGGTREEPAAFDVELGDAVGTSAAADAPRAANDPAPRQPASVVGALPPSLWPNVKPDAPLRSFRFSINPEDLGEIDVSLTKDRHGNVNAELVATTSETYVELQRDVGRDLQAILENAGVERVEVRLGGDADAKQGSNERQTERRSPESRTPGADVERTNRAPEPAVAVGVVRRLLSLRI